MPTLASGAVGGRSATLAAWQQSYVATLFVTVQFFMVDPPPLLRSAQVTGGGCIGVELPGDAIGTATLAPEKRMQVAEDEKKKAAAASKKPGPAAVALAPKAPPSKK